MSPCRRRSFAVPFLHIVPSVAFRSAPFRPRRRRTLFARASCVRARARPAPARFAHLTARARRRTHLARPFPPGFFSAPSRILRRKTKGGPGSRLSVTIVAHLSSGQAPWRERHENFSNFLLETGGPAGFQPAGYVCIWQPFSRAGGQRKGCGGGLAQSFCSLYTLLFGIHAERGHDLNHQRRLQLRPRRRRSFHFREGRRLEPERGRGVTGRQPGRIRLQRNPAKQGPPAARGRKKPFVAVNLGGGDGRTLPAFRKLSRIFPADSPNLGDARNFEVFTILALAGAGTPRGTKSRRFRREPPTASVQRESMGCSAVPVLRAVAGERSRLPERTCE